jgi:hypothetical protein
VFWGDCVTREAKFVEGRYLIIADYAEYSPSGRLSLIGGDLERITLPSLPAHTPAFKIAGKIHFDLIEKDVDHTYNLTIKDPDDVIVSDELSGTIPRAAHTFKSTSVFYGVSIVLGHSPLLVNKQGQYLVEFLVDNKIISFTSFYVFQSIAS